MREKAIAGMLWLAVFGLVLSVLIQQRVHSFSETQNARLAFLMERQLVAEGWLGERVPEGLRARYEGRISHDTPLLLWIIDLERCENCTYDIPHWNLLAETKAIQQAVLLSGGSSETQDSLRDLLDPSVYVGVVPAGEIERHLHFPFSSFRLLSSETGVVLSVDWRRPDSQCRWSYIAYITGMLGIELGIPYQLAATGPVALRR